MQPTQLTHPALSMAALFLLTRHSGAGSFPNSDICKQYTDLNIPSDSFVPFRTKLVQLKACQVVCGTRIENIQSKSSPLSDCSGCCAALLPGPNLHRNIDCLPCISLLHI